MHTITRVRVGDAYRIRLTFAEGTEGDVDLSHLVGRGVFAELRDPVRFGQVTVGEHGGLCWPNGADLCPDALYLKVAGKSPEEAFPALALIESHA